MKTRRPIILSNTNEIQICNNAFTRFMSKDLDLDESQLQGLYIHLTNHKNVYFMDITCVWNECLKWYINNYTDDGTRISEYRNAFMREYNKYCKVCRRKLFFCRLKR